MVFTNSINTTSRKAVGASYICSIKVVSGGGLKRGEWKDGEGI